MGISHITSAVMVFLTGLLPAGCHRDAAKSPHPKSSQVANANGKTSSVVSLKSFERKIGTISLTNLDDTYVQFSSGESFTLTPKILDSRNVRITLAVESKDAYGATHNFAVTQVVAEPGKPVKVAVGGYDLSFTPEVYPQN